MQFSLNDAMALLERTPRTLRAMLADLPERWTHANYGPDTWSPFQIVGHLIYGEMTDWIPRARRILEHGERKAFDPFDRAGHEPLIKGRTMASLLDEFETRRAGSLAAMSALKLTEADLDRVGLHPALGPATLRNLLAAWVVHDFNHIHQIAKAMAFQYGPEAGPWQAYLSILSAPAPR